MSSRGRSMLAGVACGQGLPTRIVAALNVSPESFYSGSVSGDREALQRAAREAVAEGADLIDIGAMSTAPYLDTHIEPEEEVRRIEWALEAVCSAVDVPVSVDTTRALVAAAALAAGARIVNDVTGLRGDAAMAEVAAQAEGVIVAASEPVAEDGDPMGLVQHLLEDSLRRAAAAGIAEERIVVDPGFGFFRATRVPPEQFTCVVLRRLGELERLGRPVLVGLSRKSSIGRLTGRSDPRDRLFGSVAAAAIAVLHGASLVRTHDVAPTRDAVRIAEAVRDVSV